VEVQPRLYSIIVDPNRGNSQSSFPNAARTPIAARVTFPASTHVPPLAGGRSGMDVNGWEAYQSKSQHKAVVKQRLSTQRVSVFRHLVHPSPATKPFQAFFLECTTDHYFKCLAPDHKVQ
jgi:hypothetical protein